ncbi:NAD-glutamate dehydrogenase [Microbacterium arabinogalactanolyticum]|uniref:NAD-glutamate dehydrogenase n=1 Tax=Microbacterium arabinogalactanolyticum TaxID=69365 RepID=A0ABQ5NEB0_9MICO|nr:NAD-glutamate dehydrogenase [Microbacterium arabinogalactanolyticum]GLC84140.1 NAD-glutamate dehydrogenase [Microbacterium arabinogalactanolyticum]
MANAVESAELRDAIAALDPDVRSGVERLIARLDAIDLAEREARDVVGAAVAMRALAARRGRGETNVSVFTPTLSEHGWTSRRTIVDICTDDAPFLVDSVTSALAAQGLAVHLLLHPLVEVHRDDDGRLLETDARGGALESWIHLEVDRVPTEEGRDALAERLLSVLADVHASVDDWSAMRRACLDLVTDLRTAPPATADPAAVGPAVDFFSWLADDNFTFLGYREYSLETDDSGEDVLVPIPHSGLGILRKPTTAVAHLRPEAQRTAREPRLLTITKANSRATVHRDVYLDYIGARMFDEAGEVIGERRFLGLFTSGAYAASVMTLPIAADKVRAVLDASGFAPMSHSGKDLLGILEQYPRDELFQDSVEHLLKVVTEVTRLNERRRARTFLRRDEFGRFVSVLVYLPKDRYNTPVRLRIEAVLREVFGAEQVDHATRVADSPLAQLHFVVRMPRGTSLPDVAEGDLQLRLADAVRGWDEGLVDALHHAHGDDEAARLLADYGQAFPAVYKETVTPDEAVGDVALLEQLREREFAVRLNVPEKDVPGKRVLTLASREEYPLTRVLPVLTDLGVDVVDERPYTISLPDGTRWHVSDFGLTAEGVDRWIDPTWGATFEDAFSATWTGAAESDRLNTLVLHGGLDWRRIVILRAIAMYLRQAGSAFSVEYTENALVSNPGLAATLVRLFELRFDPSVEGDRDAQIESAEAELLEGLDQVASLDDDRILRSFDGVIAATWRTNFYQPAADGTPKPWVSMKLDCARVPGLPKPLPMAEIWVYSPEVEGVHLRFGKVARGGLRWSDRREDFRTEVLGLVKAQMVKNAVIVPTGSKGGFFAKRLPAPGDRAAWLEAGKSAYRTFIRGLLDLTDNRVGSDVVPPADVVRHDGDDPYLVVAADKGTASFSDIANGISEEYGFWLADAFASGGSAGYDHKAMGITARGAWESVKRHFRELGLDTQTEDFTVVGIGDMSGDVFGNGMLRSRHIRLVAAFDHRHVFIDPNPDAESTFAERERLFNLPGSSWDDFDRSVISAGGGVYPLSMKSIAVTPEMAEALRLDPAVTKMTPMELKKAVLLAPVDLLWNGAIGTYIKASDESDAEVGDRGNDAVRVDGRELRLRVVGEGGNLGVTQRGRIEAASAGIRINTDAIDNSAGVGTSDREVNIKILLGILEREGRLDRPARNELLQSMTDEVAVQVLRDNYEQNVLLGNSRANAGVMLPVHERLMEWLEERDELDRELEFLPSRAKVAELIADQQGLTRPEFAVLVAYAKLALKADLAATGLADDPWFERTLAEYFPAPIREAYAGDLDAHPLRTEIIVNTVVNSMVNRGGITFAYRAADETGATSEDIARAYVAVREIFDLRGFVVAVEATDNVVSTDVQTDLYLTFRRLLDRATRWFVQHRPDGVDIGAEIELFREPVAHLSSNVDTWLQGVDLERFESRTSELQAAGVPAELARRGAGLLDVLSLLDIAECARTRGWTLEDVAGLYFALSARLAFEQTLTKITALPQTDRWGSMARASMRDDLYAVMIELTATVAAQTEADAPEARIEAWLEQGGASTRRTVDEAIAAATAQDGSGLATLSVAVRRLRSLVR